MAFSLDCCNFSLGGLGVVFSLVFDFGLGWRGSGEFSGRIWPVLNEIERFSASHDNVQFLRLALGFSAFVSVRGGRTTDEGVLRLFVSSLSVVHDRVVCGFDCDGCWAAFLVCPNY